MVCAGPGYDFLLCELRTGRGTDAESGRGISGDVLPGGRSGQPDGYDPHGGGTAAADRNTKGAGIQRWNHCCKVFQLRDAGYRERKHCGILIGEKLLPYVIMDAYGMLYTGLPEYFTPLNWDQGALALLAAAASTGIATLAACFRELRSKPAELMRPEAPKSGKRVFLERITPLWKRLNFTYKSTLRNLIRYKKRFFMTIIGIGGCMALMLVGYGLEDSITEIAKRQYVEIFTYDASVTLNTKDSAGGKKGFPGKS